MRMLSSPCRIFIIACELEFRFSEATSIGGKNQGCGLAVSPVLSLGYPLFWFLFL